ncbi:MAG: CZB domain-containing protein [gamma proteobacterium symbiont of Bathyaustriella thionipta]|nr:CZB domain-containing protein [gamma proteobacterium symbiont of Bathyaustriella thionipta]
MDTQKALLLLRDARQAHRQWVVHARALVQGLPIKKESVPLEPTHCDFGRWYYSYGQDLLSLPEFSSIEVLHDELHLLYMQIHSGLFQQEKPSLMARMLGQKAQPDLQQRKKALQDYKQLDMISRMIISKIDKLIAQLESMTKIQNT